MHPDSYRDGTPRKDVWVLVIVVFTTILSIFKVYNHTAVQNKQDMDAKEFVKAIRSRVIEDDNKAYRDLLNNTNDTKDIIWAGMLPIYKSMTKQEQDTFLDFLKLIQVNTVSHVFGILDGSSYLSENGPDFFLRTEPNGDLINGDLQDIFWETEEE